jgi:hypothetical protein
MLFGFGMGLIMGQTNNLALSALPASEAGEAAGVNNTFRQVGMSLGAAIIGSILLSTLATNLSSGVAASTVIPPSSKPEVAQLVSSQSSNIEFGTQATFTNVPAVVVDEVTAISHQATVKADKTAFSWGVFFGLLSLLLSTYIPLEALVAGEEGNIPPKPNYS